MTSWLHPDKYNQTVNEEERFDYYTNYDNTDYYNLHHHNQKTVIRLQPFQKYINSAWEKWRNRKDKTDKKVQTVQVRFLAGCGDEREIYYQYSGVGSCSNYEYNYRYTGYEIPINYLPFIVKLTLLSKLRRNVLNSMNVSPILKFFAMVLNSADRAMYPNQY